MQVDVQKILDEMNHKINALSNDYAALHVSQSKNKAAVIVLKARVVDLKIRMAEQEKQKETE